MVDNTKNNGKLVPILAGLAAAISADIWLGWHGYSIIICTVVLITVVVGNFFRRKMEIPRPELLKRFKRPASESYIGNLYERAIERNETIDFLLGKGIYYMPVDLHEWCGQHAPSNSFRHMEEYARIYSDERMLKCLEEDIRQILMRENLSTEYFNFTLNYIWLYYSAFYLDKILTVKWEISTTIKERITCHLNNFIHLYGIEGGAFDCNTPRNEFFTKAAMDNISRIKQKFGVDLLNS